MVPTCCPSPDTPQCGRNGAQPGQAESHSVHSQQTSSLVRGEQRGWEAEVLLKALQMFYTRLKAHCPHRWGASANLGWLGANQVPGAPFVHVTCLDLTKSQLAPPHTPHQNHKDQPKPTEFDFRLRGAPAATGRPTLGEVTC